MDGERPHMMYHRHFFRRMGMRRLCGLLLFSVGFGMIWVLILPDTFCLVVAAVGLMILGYNLFCG